MKKSKVKTKSVGFTCVNVECGRDFSNPVVVDDLSSEARLSYNACPYCLTRIIESTTEADEKEGKSRQTRVRKKKAKPLEVMLAEPEEQQPSAKELDCPHHFGYLSHRSRNESIPDECITCEKIVECMLKKIM